MLSDMQLQDSCFIFVIRQHHPLCHCFYTSADNLWNQKSHCQQLFGGNMLLNNTETPPAVGKKHILNKFKIKLEKRFFLNL